MDPVARSKRRYRRLTPTEWGEARGLWESGGFSLAELSDKFDVSERALQLHFKREGTIKGSAAGALVAAVKERVLQEELEDPDVLTSRAKAIRETAYQNAVIIESLMMRQLEAAQNDPSQALRAGSALKMLHLAAGALERLHTLKREALGLDRDSVLPDEMPELVIRDLTVAEIEELQKANNDDNLDEVVEDDVGHRGSAQTTCIQEHLVPLDPTEDDEIVIEGEHEGSRDLEEEDDDHVDADGYRLVREARR